MVLWMASIFALAGIAGQATAHAAPPPPGTPCTFELSAPRVAPVAGADMVIATVTPTGCLGPFTPRISVVCVQPADAPTQCSQARDMGTAQVSVPYRPGATYTSTGRGLGAVFNDASEPNWQLLGPIPAVL